MKIIREYIQSDINLKQLCRQANEDVLFFDIETTGFHRTRTRLYMIGYVFFEEGKWYVEQHFADEFEDEKLLLINFLELLKQKKVLISFNGDTFDIPYIRAKLERYCILDDITIPSLDLYKVVRSYKKRLNLPNCKLKTVEKLVGIHREDPFTGGQLIEQYHIYMENKDHRLEYNLLLHNKEDMIALLDLMMVYDIFNSIDTISSATVHSYEADHKCFKVRLKPTKAFTTPLSLTLGELSIQLHEEILIKGPIYERELKFFFPNYKSYYYIPEKDEAMHKSIAEFLPKEKKEKAKASNCYTKHLGSFIPLLRSDEQLKVFIEKHRSKEYFTMVNVLHDPTTLQQYSRHILSALGSAE